VRSSEGVIELRATGMPLGLMPDMSYDEQRYRMTPGEVMVLTSDGITEAHSPEGEMYGFARLMNRVARKPSDGDLVAAIVTELESFTGETAEQEDDITLVVVRRTMSAQESASAFDHPLEMIDRFTLASEDGNERIAIDRVTVAVDPLALETGRLERLKTAVGETVMNAIEHGNQNRQDLDVDVEVSANEHVVSVRVTDQGGRDAMPEVATPDIEAKLAGEQTPRGWGLFLIEQMVDEVRWTSDGEAHTIELIMNREGVG
jgi:anti-sigma regulatory factor (Ser/Thr protein kinase)